MDVDALGGGHAQKDIVEDRAGKGGTSAGKAKGGATACGAELEGGERMGAKLGEADTKAVERRDRAAVQARAAGLRARKEGAVDEGGLNP